MRKFLVGWISSGAILALCGHTALEWQWYAICAAMVIFGINYSID